MTKVLCVGSAVADFLFQVDQIPDKAEKYAATDAAIVGGGIAANAAVGIVRLGGIAVLAARIGDDAIGDVVLNDLQREGVDISHIQRTAGGRSSFSAVCVDPGGERQIVNFRGADLEFPTGWFCDLDAVDAVLVDTRYPPASLAALEFARDRGIPGIVDGEAPIDPALLDAASHAAFSAPGLESLYSGVSAGDAVAQAATDYDLWAAVTDGANGVHYIQNGAVHHCPSVPVQAVDTLAAGDVWHGAFALCLAEGQSEKDAVLFANAAAALKCKKLGGRAGAPNRADVNEFLEEIQP